MANPDASDYDDDRSRDADRPARAVRPAWDAGTYGVPDDTWRLRPSGRPTRRPEPAPPPYEPPPPPSYQPSPYEPPPSPSYERSYEPSSYEPSSYEPSSYEPSPYEPPAAYSSPSYGSSSSDTSDSYRLDAYPAATDTYVAGAFADLYPAASSASSSSYSSSYEPPPVDLPVADEVDPYPPEPYDYPGGLDDEDADEAAVPERTGRAGRNLPAAIGVGLLLGAIVVSSLFVWRPAFLVVVALAVGVGIWELVRAIRTSGANPPLVPLVVGGALMTGLAWWGHTDALTFGLVVTVLAAMAWRLSDGPGGYGRDVTAATLVAVYVPFLAGFAALLASPADGGKRVIVTLAAVVLSDTGGYIAGVLFGRHPMAPTVSPKKSWEGVGGSLGATAIGGALLLFFLFDVAVWWGALFGLAVSAAAVLGDLGESLIKRDLGVKDMGTLLPGHGGIMDRLDSIVFAAPTAYALLVVLAPPL